MQSGFAYEALVTAVTLPVLVGEVHIMCAASTYYFISGSIHQSLSLLQKLTAFCCQCASPLTSTGLMFGYIMLFFPAWAELGKLHKHFPAAPRHSLMSAGVMSLIGGRCVQVQ